MGSSVRYALVFWRELRLFMIGFGVGYRVGREGGGGEEEGGEC